MIKKFYQGQIVELNLVKEPISHKKIKVDGIDKFFPITEPVECTVHSVNYCEGKLDFIKNNRPSVVFHNYTPKAEDKIIKDIDQTLKTRVEEIVPIIKRIKGGDEIILSLPIEPFEYVKDDNGKFHIKLEPVECRVHGVNEFAETISYTKDADRDHRIFRNFKVTEDNVVFNKKEQIEEIKEIKEEPEHKKRGPKPRFTT